jgi:peptidoglycan hydrolase-like protein with peptidoglycan-binding domain
MKHNKAIVTAIILAGSISSVAQPTPAQTQPVRTNPLENRTSEKQYERRQSPTSGTSQEIISGMSADDVIQVKEALKAEGFNPGPMNGTMDSQTQQALRRFQEHNNLAITGAPDQQTVGKLGVTVGRDADSSQDDGSSHSASHGDSGS